MIEASLLTRGLGRIVSFWGWGTGQSVTHLWGRSVVSSNTWHSLARGWRGQIPLGTQTAATRTKIRQTIREALE